MLTQSLSAREMECAKTGEKDLTFFFFSFCERETKPHKVPPPLLSLVGLHDQQPAFRVGKKTLGHLFLFFFFSHSTSCCFDTCRFDPSAGDSRSSKKSVQTTIQMSDRR